MNSPLHFHFLGICGTAMGAVASAMARKGHKITGSDDKVYPPMSTFLEQEGISITQGYHKDNLPRSADYIVVGNAMSRGNEEVEELLNRKQRYLSLPEAMKEFFLSQKRNFVVTGTHGKTTTTSILTWLMEDSGLNPSFMIGGIARNLKRGGRFTDSPFCVIEGDEYDTAFFDKRSKFVHYLPELAIINNIEFDHADIFANLDEIKTSFRRLVTLIPANGLLLVNGDDKNCIDVVSNPAGKKNYCPVSTVGLGESCEFRISGVSYKPDGATFWLGGEEYSIPLAGEFNVRNAAMAICAATFAGLDAGRIRSSLLRFKGVARRQEIRGEQNGILVIDDFAHHPTAIAEAIKGMRQRFPARRLWVLFDPRSNTTRRNIFQRELSHALSLADMAVISRVEDPEKISNPDERLDTENLVKDINLSGTEAFLGENPDDIVKKVCKKAQRGDILLIMSNGGFGGIHEKLLDALKNL